MQTGRTGRSPTVSVIIPTLNRPNLLARALESVFQQTFRSFEILVILDGPCMETQTVLKRFRCQHLRVLALNKQSGVSAARNYGIEHATGDWIAFLDDDDEWLPNKLENQLRVARNTTWRYPIVCGRLIVRTPNGDCVLPRRGPSHGETISHYLFCRNTLLPWEVLLQTSNLLTSRSLLQQVRFREGLSKWDDTDWLLRAAQLGGAGLDFIDEPLSIWYAEDGTRRTVSSALDWRYVFEWAKTNRELFSRSAFSGVLLVDVAREAMRERAKMAWWSLLKEASKHGEPDLIQLLSFIITIAFTWFLPHRLLRHFRRFSNHFFPVG